MFCVSNKKLHLIRNSCFKVAIAFLFCSACRLSYLQFWFSHKRDEPRGRAWKISRPVVLRRALILQKSVLLSEFLFFKVMLKFNQTHRCLTSAHCTWKCVYFAGLKRKNGVGDGRKWRVLQYEDMLEDIFVACITQWGIVNVISDVTFCCCCWYCCDAMHHQRWWNDSPEIEMAQISRRRWKMVMWPVHRALEHLWCNQPPKLRFPRKV